MNDPTGSGGGGGGGGGGAPFGPDPAVRSMGVGAPGYSQDPLAYEPHRARAVSFYLAIFLGLLLLLSGALNLLLLFVSMFGSAAAGFAPIGDSDSAMYDVVGVGGDPEAETRVLRIAIDGPIAEGSSPLLGASGGTVSAVRRALKLAERDDSIKGVLLDVNSPGGGVTDSDLIYRAITDFRKDSGKPVVALFGDIAASGGYYVAAACDAIYARETTMTGSIGVIISSLNWAEAAAEHGLRQEVIVSERTPYKDMLSPFRPMRDDEAAIMRSIVDEMYDRFVEVVTAGRPALDRDAVVKLADGRVYSAKQAQQNGLIDGIRTLDTAYAELAERCGVDRVRAVEQRRRPTLADMLFQSRSDVSGLGALSRLLEQSTGPRLLYWWPGAR